MSRARRRGAALIVALLAAGCAPPSPPAGEATDLTTLLPGAEAWTETTALAFGARETGRFLRGGFASARRARHVPFLFGVGRGSALGFRRADTRAFTLRLRGSTVPGQGPETVHVKVLVNGARAGAFDLGPRTATAAVDVPSTLLEPGENELGLEYEAASTAAGGGTRGLPVMAAWHGVRFGEERAAGLPGALAGGGLTLPRGSGLDFFLGLAGGARLELERVSTRGDTRLAADVECDGDAGGARTVVAGVRSATVASLRGAGASRALCRLTLRASGGEGEAAGVEIGAARVRQSAPAGPFAALGTPPTATPAVPAAGAPPPPASLVIYLVDTLRADRLGVYGYRQPVSPAIDRFARDAVVFEQARAQSSWTRPAVGTVLTGLDPVRHGATRSLSRLADAATTLGERLQAAGYWTGMATANPNVGQEFGFDQGFDDFVCVDCRGETGDDGEITAAVHRAALAGLDRAPSGRPFFLFVHTVEPHAPYRPTEPFRARFAADADPDLGERRTLSRLAHGSLELTPARERAVGELYDAEVALADAGFGAFLEQLARRGRLDDTAVLFLSDHGEELFEHGNVEHGRTLFEEQLRIPMIWRLPRGAHGGRRVAVPVDQLDIAPTVLALAGAPADPDLPGRDLSSVLEGGPTPEERPSLAWLDRRSFSLESVAFRRAKLVRDLTPDAVTVPFTETLFDLAADPGERRDLAGTRGLLRAFLASQLRAFRNRWGAALPTRDALTDPALRNRLRALGYLH